MGGYGVVNVDRRRLQQGERDVPGAPPNQLLRRARRRQPRLPEDDAIRGSRRRSPSRRGACTAGFWDADGLKGITTPVLFVAGSVDDVAGYEKGTKAILQGAVNADRYLLTFLDANHNAAAPIPAPAETYAYPEALQVVSVRALRRCGVGHDAHEQHPRSLLATAYFDLYVKGDAAKLMYLDTNGPLKGFKPAHGGWPHARTSEPGR